jgi:YihY family inner membrane protein
MASGNEQVVKSIIGYIDNTNVKTLGWMGVAFLLVTVFSMVSSVEQAFNTIWGVKRGRSAWRKFTDFFSVILIMPVIFIVATSTTVTVQKSDIVQRVMEVSGLGWLESLMLKSAPLALLWLAFTFMYSYVPNTKVSLKSAALGGAVAAILWQLSQGAYIRWQMGFNNYNAIYGSFAQLPLFLIWMYIGWIIVLFGAEMCVAVQHLRRFTKQQFIRKASLVQRQKLAVIMMLLTVRPFREGCALPDVEEISDRLMIPREMVVDLFRWPLRSFRRRGRSAFLSCHAAGTHQDYGRTARRCLRGGRGRRGRGVRLRGRSVRFPCLGRLQGSRQRDPGRLFRAPQPRGGCLSVSTRSRSPGVLTGGRQVVSRQTCTASVEFRSSAAVSTMPGR